MNHTEISYTGRPVEQDGHLTGVVLMQRTTVTPISEKGQRLLRGKSVTTDDWEITVPLRSADAMVSELISWLTYFAGPEAAKDRE